MHIPFVTWVVFLRERSSFSLLKFEVSHSSECQYYDLLIMGVINFAQCYVNIVSSCIVSVLIIGFIMLFPS